MMSPGIDTGPEPEIVNAERAIIARALAEATGEIAPVNNGGESYPTNPAPPAPPVSLRGMLQQIPQETHSEKVTIRVAEQIQLDLRLPEVHLDKNSSSITLMLPEGIDITPEFGISYELVYKGTTWEAIFAGSKVKVPSLPWTMLSFLIKTDDDKDRTSRGGEDSLDD